MKKNMSVIIGLITMGLLMGGCTFKRTATSPSTHLDGTKVDYSQMQEYKHVETCYNFKKTEDASVSILEVAKKAGIKEVVYVDKSVTGDITCVIVYGE